MSDISTKYNNLDKVAKQELDDFLDYLLSRQRNSKQNPIEEYKQRILSVSTWDENDCNVFEENRKTMNQWTIQNW
jgi:hypothetical protein